MKEDTNLNCCINGALNIYFYKVIKVIDITTNITISSLTFYNWNPHEVSISTPALLPNVGNKLNFILQQRKCFMRDKAFY